MIDKIVLKSKKECVIVYTGRTAFTLRCPDGRVLDLLVQTLYDYGRFVTFREVYESATLATHDSHSFIK